MQKTLKEMIKERGIKQLEIAKEMNISESHISLMIRGKRRMNIDQAFQLASMMELSIDDVYHGLKLQDDMSL